MSTPIYKTPFVMQNGVLASPESYRFFTCPSNSQILIRSVDSFCDAHAHWHDFVQIWYILDGVFEHTIHGKTECLSAGDLAIVPLFHQHALRDCHETPFQTVCIEFSVQYLESIIEDAYLRSVFLRPLEFAGSATSFSLPMTVRPWVDVCIRRLAAEFSKDPQRCLILFHEELAKLLRLLAEEALAFGTFAESASWQHFNMIYRVLKYTQAHYQDNITLEKISRYCQMSRSGFSRLFKEITGNTYLEYLHIVRTSIATRYLDITEMSIPEIILLSGFRTRANFYRYYQYYVGLSPTQVRKGIPKERLN